MRLSKVLLVTVGATALLGALVSTASARSFRWSNTFHRAAFTSIEVTGGLSSVECPLTLTGEIHATTTAKVLEALIGYFEGATLGACTRGSATLLTATLPWHVRYAGFQGLLPEITMIFTKIIGFAFRIRETGGITCLVSSTAAEPVSASYDRTTASGVLTALRIGGEIRTGMECLGARVRLRSTAATFTSLGGSNVTITLI